MKDAQASYRPKTRADQNERELAPATGAQRQAVRRLQLAAAGIEQTGLAIAALKRPFYEIILRSAILLRLVCILPALCSGLPFVSRSMTVRMAP